MNGAGNVVVFCTYDAWGNILDTSGTLATTLGKHNPLRYRSYVYDTETQLYYLQSRYFNPKVGRFINADGLISTGQGMLGNNMFAYCGNNPVARVDFSGTAYKKAVTMSNISGNASKVQIGPPPDYVPMDDNQHNCYSYAFGLDKRYDPGELSGHGTLIKDGKKFYTVSEIKDLVQADIDSGHVDARVISNPNELKEGEYLVALKTSKKPSPNTGGDYHFAILLSNGTWADKPGPGPSRWNAINGFARTWALGNDLDYYDSDTVYFAVRKKE